MKKNERPKINRDNKELNPLNSELGSFGLEPPKIYRSREKIEEKSASTKNTNSQSVKSKKNNTKSKSKNTTKKQNLTKSEKNAINKKKRKLKKKFRVTLSILALIIALAIVMVILSLTVFFKIDTINVSGSSTYDYDQITAVLPIYKDENLFLIDKKQSEEKLKENLPYIYSVEIKRELPSTVIVEITEPETIYYVQNNNETYTYFDDTFKAIEVSTSDKPAKGVEIKKIALDDCVAGQTISMTDDSNKSNLEDMMKVIYDLKLSEITCIYSESLTSNYLVYDDRITIKIGETDNIEYKINSALASIEKLNETNPEATGTITSTGGKQVYFTDQR